MSKHHHKQSSRRKFLSRLGLGCAHVGAVSLLSGMTNMTVLNAAAKSNFSFVNNEPTGYKALVCILLAGGNDSFNMLTPRGNDEYNEYASVRTNLALEQNSLLPINPLNPDGKQYGLHPNLPKTQALFENENLAFVANVGALVRPTTLNDVKIGNKLPLGLYSHSDQQLHWQTSVPNDRSSLGWGGKLADIVRANNNNQDISMNISLDGVNLFQKGRTLSPYAITRKNNGSVLIKNFSDNSFYETLKREAVEDLVTNNYANVLEKALAKSFNKATGNSVTFDAALAAAGDVTTTFSGGSLSDKLKMVARTIKARDIFDVKRQTFFINAGGYDTHDEILDNHANLMRTLDDGLHSFNEAMIELGLEDQVTTFTMSDFGRKLISNGDGSDHAWGGHSLIMGGAVKGKRIYGAYPELYPGAPLDVGAGRILPTTSCDEYFSELALWFGVNHSQLVDIYPNIKNFYQPISNTQPIGFMAL